jgi:hypothetical protein
MRCFFMLAACLLMTLSLIAQTDKKMQEDEDRVFTGVETLPGTNEKAWNTYIKKASILPASVSAGIPRGIYTVLVRFTINKEGNIVDIKAKSNPGYGLSVRAKTIIADYDGGWRPANQCGRNVSSYKEQEIRFVVNK